MEYRLARRIGSFSATLRGLAIGARGEIYAAGDDGIHVLDPAGWLVRRWATERPPLSVAIAGDGSVYAGELRQIEIFDIRGRLIRTWRDEKLLGRVTGIGFAGESILAGDSAGRVIRRFDRQGRLLNNIGNDNPVHGLLIPNGVVSFGVDGEGFILAANPGKHRVERYSVDGKLLGHIGRFSGTDPAGFTGCCNPTNVAVHDAIYVTEKAGPRVKAYEFAGALRAVIGGREFDPNCKNMSIAVDRGCVYVADSVKPAILVFEPVKQ